jgi:hypothetical protein
MFMENSVLFEEVEDAYIRWDIAEWNKEHYSMIEYYANIFDTLCERYNEQLDEKTN